MIREYDIQGMTCNGCRNKVESLLNSVDGVEKASVDLDHNMATIQSSNEITIDSFRNILPDKYHISKKTQGTVISNSEGSATSELQQLYPLFLIFGYITIASVLLNYKPWDTSGFMLDFMGLFYIVFSFFKMLDLKGFPMSFAMYDPLAKALPVYGWMYPFIETVLGILFLMRLEIEIALIVTVIVLSITTIGVTKILLDKKTIQCACLGTALKLPMTKATFIENSIMLVMAFWMLFNLYY